MVDISSESGRLVAGVSENGAEPEEVILSDAIDNSSDEAFIYHLLSRGDEEIDSDKASYAGEQVTAVEVELTLRIDGESRSFSRVVRLVEPAPVVVIQ